jgi:hypothetical protein
LPQEVSGLSPSNSGDADLQICHWQRQSTDAAASLEVEVDFYQAGSDGGSAADTAHQKLTQDQDESVDPTYLPHVDPLPGVGDEGWIGALNHNLVAGPDENHTRSYWMGGAELAVRVRNVLIKVSWSAASYPSNAASQSTLRGRNLSYDTSSQQATAIVHAIIPKLT